MHLVAGGDDDAMASWQRTRPPDNEVPGTVPVDAVVTRGEDAALVLRTVVVHGAGPSWGLPEGSAIVPGEAVAAADARRVALWPWTPVPPAAAADVAPPGPTPPPGGWFERALGAAPVAGPQDRA